MALDKKQEERVTKYLDGLKKLNKKYKCDLTVIHNPQIQVLLDEHRTEPKPE